ncbi:MAG: nucleoside hydrolase [Sedimentisphaeraceae bacterium JB056]
MTYYPTPIIIDTDLGNDIDDALAIAIAHYLDNAGECELIGVAVNKDNKYSPAMVDVLNTFYGKGNIPIGSVSKGKTPEDGPFLKNIVESTNESGYKYGRSCSDYNLDSVDMYRKLLSESDNASVNIVSIGFMTNLARLLASKPDSYSPLTGVELVAEKVNLLSIMAGNFTKEALESKDIKFAEFNVKHDIESSIFVCENWPGDILFSGLEVGSAIMYTAEAIYNDYGWAVDHPVVEAYKMYLEMPYDRQTWDLTSVLCAVRDPLEYFDLSERGKVTVDNRGVTSFTPQKDGRDRYLIVRPERVGHIQQIMRQMCAYEPKALSAAVVTN